MEFPAYLEVPVKRPALKLNLRLGQMFFGWYREARGVLPDKIAGTPRNLPHRTAEQPLFFDAVVQDGRLAVPSYQSVVRANRGAA
jgi:hypothetical protein